ncbi:hypothetical protein Y032_0011g1455 [Ancylostoma ceylanicum]|uniref:Uncharacterized protein n=1 Tax=Ancylostoma ceylanicum TaxID=53326 RepID=A0A016VE25_9BILA|nr:hypothetical protein Y032_0011g1455 [Ancylostoma ceylanicum]
MAWLATGARSNHRWCACAASLLPLRHTRPCSLFHQIYFATKLDTRLRVIQGFKIQSVGHDEAKDLFVLTCARFHHTCSCKFECEWGRVDSEGREDTAPFCYIMTHTQNSFSAD